MSTTRRRWVIPLLLLVLSVAFCAGGCQKFKPTPLSEDQIPDEIRDLFEASDETLKVEKVEYFVLEEEGDELVVIAVVSGVDSLGNRNNYLSFGTFKAEPDQDGNVKWNLLSMFTRKGYAGGGAREKKYRNTEYPHSMIGVAPGLRRTAGWILDSRVERIEVSCFTGETVTAKIKNGFWWTEPYDWGNNWPRQKTVAYDSSGELLYEVDLSERD